MLSIVIPVYHEHTPEQKIYRLWEKLLESLFKQETSWELIVVEVNLCSESSLIFSYILQYFSRKPSTPHTTHTCHLELLHTQKQSKICRSVAINKAIELSQGSHILVLHEDMILPEGALLEIESALSTFDTGGFLKEYVQNTPSMWMSFLEMWLNNIRTRQGKHLVGSNAMYFKKKLWEEHHFQGNFMEDVEFSDWQRLYLKGKIYISPLKVQVSARRYQSMKAWRCIFLNGCILLLYRYGKADLPTLRKKLYEISPDISHWKFFFMIFKSILKSF